jgi:hypothetical protein
LKKWKSIINLGDIIKREGGSYKIGIIKNLRECEYLIEFNGDIHIHSKIYIDNERASGYYLFKSGFSRKIKRCLNL